MSGRWGIGEWGPIIYRVHLGFAELLEWEHLAATDDDKWPSCPQDKFTKMGCSPFIPPHLQNRDFALGQKNGMAPAGLLGCYTLWHFI
ncbi:hypothetical protein [Microcoleus sp. FACHB-672]|uniref:hypothetical protein n=1 Tax=Microcoleus sp. FACHB-672 TaxID=2692825 RepID=UPI0016886FAF|nr:hypothetical protein [Microcoleus sp. FACHB-672]MBD2041607.1 hypothetical protein [Microcoleus sp. FACHB-672]